MLHTNDGREYLTPQQLQREIKDELYVARGRSSLVDLANALNVDYSHIEHQAQLLAKQVCIFGGLYFIHSLLYVRKTATLNFLAGFKG